MATTDIYHISGSLAGKSGVAFLGGAVDDQIEIDAFAVTRTAADDTEGTFTAWINVPDNTGTYAIISVGDENIVEYITFEVEAGTLRAACADNTNVSWDINTAANTIKPHRWYHVALVQDGTKSTPKIYINGVDMAITVTNSDLNDDWFENLDGLQEGSIGAAEVGGDAGLTLEFKGCISNVKYWDVGLTADQVSQDYDGQAPDDITGTTGDLTNWWLLDGDYIDSVAAENGTKGGDIVLNNNYSEFTSRFRFMTGAPAVADKFECFADQGVGHAIVIQAA